MKCEYCPLKDSHIPCVGDDLNHKPACDAVNPDNPKYNPQMIQGVINNSTDLYNKKHHPELIKPPTFTQKVMNLAGAVQKIAEEGYKEVSSDVYNSRLSQCNTCEFRTVHWTCSHPSCGCFLSMKAKISTESCPIGKWGLEFMEDEEVNKLRSVSVDQMMKESVLVMASGGVGGGCGCGSTV